MDQIGLEAILDDRNFQAGLARYMAGLAKAESATQKTAGALTSLGRVIETALGTAIGFLSAQALPRLTDALLAPLNVTRAYGEAMDTLQETLGFSNEAAAQFVVGMKAVGLAPEEGTQALGTFVRQIAATRDQLSQAGAAFASAASEIRDNFTRAVEEASARRLEIWGDLAEQVRGIESELADNIASIQEGLAERLADLAEQRGEIDRDLEKSLAKLDRDYQRNRRNTRGRARRELKEEYEEQRQALIDQAAERKAQLDKQEARERAQAAKQIALAEKVAAKQIAAAEKAADKQIEAIEKSLKKEAELRDKALAKAQATMATTGAQSPFAKALADLGLKLDQVTDQAGNLTEHGLDLIMDAFQKLPAGVKASNIALQLFGRTGLKFLDWMRSDRDEAKRLAKELGIVFDPDVTQQFDRQLSKLGLAFDALAINLGKHALPYLTDFVKTVNGLLQQGMPTFVDLLDRVNAGFKKGGLEGALTALQAWADDPKNRGRLDALGKKIGDLLGAGIGAITGGANFVAQTVGRFLESAGTWAATGEGRATINAATAQIGNALLAGLNAFLQATAWIGSVMLTLCLRLEEWVSSEEGKKAVAGLTQAFAGAVLAGIGAIFGSDREGENLISRLAWTLWRAANSLARSIASIGATIAADVVGGIAEYFFGPAAAQRIKDSVYSGLSRALALLIGPGGPLVQIGSGIATALYNAFAGKWSELMGGFDWLFNFFGLGGAAPARHGGGPIPSSGLYNLLAGEYVLNRQQARVMAPVLAGGTTVNYYASHTWNGPASAFDRGEVARVSRGAAEQVLREHLEGA